MIIENEKDTLEIIGELEIPEYYMTILQRLYENVVAVCNGITKPLFIKVQRRAGTTFLINNLQKTIPKILKNIDNNLFCIQVSCSVRGFKDMFSLAANISSQLAPKGLERLSPLWERVREEAEKEADEVLKRLDIHPTYYNRRNKAKELVISKLAEYSQPFGDLGKLVYDYFTSQSDTKKTLILDYLSLNEISRRDLVTELKISYHITKSSVLEYLHGLTSLIASCKGITVIYLDDLPSVFPTLTLTKKIAFCESLKYLTDPYTLKNTLVVCPLSSRALGTISNLSPPLSRRFFYPVSQVVSLKLKNLPETTVNKLLENLDLMKRRVVFNSIKKANITKIPLVYDIVRIATQLKNKQDLLVYSMALKRTSELLETKDSICYAIMLRGLRKALKSEIMNANVIFKGDTLYGVKWRDSPVDNEVFVILSYKREIRTQEENPVLFENLLKENNIDKIIIVSIEIEPKLKLPSNNINNITLTKWSFSELVNLVVLSDVVSSDYSNDLKTFVVNFIKSKLRAILRE